MLIAQLTDIHLGFDLDDPDELNAQRFEQVLAHIERRRVKPDLLVVSGDLTEHGDSASYLRVVERLAKLPCPVHYAFGNHDIRADFRAVVDDAPSIDGFLQYAVEVGDLRMLVLDTLEEGRHGGAFCETRADWLRAELRRAPDAPTLIVMHHPPFDTGIEWLTTLPDEPWVGQFRDAIAGAHQIRAVVSGHVHRPIVTSANGVSMMVAPSIAPAVHLTLAPMDPGEPDDRPLVTAEPPGYALHLWRGGHLVSHFTAAIDYPALAKFDARMQGLVAHLRDERAQ